MANEGHWPTQQAIKDEGHCSTRRAKRALIAAQHRAAKSIDERRFDALAMLAGFTDPEDARRAVDQLEGFVQRDGPQINGMTPLRPRTGEFTKQQLRAALALLGFQSDPDEEPETLHQRLFHAVTDQPGATDFVSKQLRVEEYVRLTGEDFYATTASQRANALLDDSDTIIQEIQDERVARWDENNA